MGCPEQSCIAQEYKYRALNKVFASNQHTLSDSLHMKASCNRLQCSSVHVRNITPKGITKCPKEQNPTPILLYY